MTEPHTDSARVLASLTGVVKRYGDLTVLEGLDFEVRAGEVVGLLGPNGAGKTTSVRILCGLLDMDAGQATLAGHDVAAHPIEARKSLGYVPDGAPLYPNLSARQHLALVAGLHGMDEGPARVRADHLLAGFDLSDRGDDPVGRFSRGMRQKTAIACALLPEPELLVLDEPLSGLDAPSASTIKALLRGWADRGGAVLYTSHLLDVVERVCDRMLILSGGRLVGSGSLEELRTAAGRDGTLEQVFGTLARTEDPEARARALLNPGS